MRVKAFFVALLGLMTVSVTVNATAILVNSAVDPSDPPRCTLHDAILAANTGVAVNGCKAGSGNDVISFSSGSKITLQATLPTIERTLQINGRPTQPKTVISGNNAVQIMVIDTTAVVSLSNLTLANGVGGPGLPAPFFPGTGGSAIFNQGNLTVNLSTFTNNNATGQGEYAAGAAIFDTGGLSVSNSSFIGNHASADTFNAAAAVYAGGSSAAIIKNCTFVGNTSSGTDGMNGEVGGLGSAIVQASNSSLTVEGSTFTNNTVTAESGFATGAISQAAAGLTTIKDCTFNNNSVSVTSGNAAGGAFGSGGQDVNIEDSTFSGNSASSQSGVALGGAVGSEGAGMTVSGSTFIGNSVSGGPGTTFVGGGGIGNGGGGIAITNNTFFKNTASGNSATGVFGGGVGGFNVPVFFSTFLDNSATNSGGTASGGNFGVGGSEIANSILAGAVAGGNCVGTFTDGGYNISDDASCAFNATGSRNSTNPKLATRPASNGGPTQTIALIPGSPAIDQIPIASCVDSNDDPVTVDQRGKPRPDRGDGPNGPCDIGAYELQDPAFPP